MSFRHSFFGQSLIKPNAAVSVGLFVLLVGLMAWLRLYLFGDRVISLTYGLPLLVCLWYPDRRLLWSMTGAFLLMSAWKIFVVLPTRGADSSLLAWGMQAINILVIASVVHLIIDLLAALRAQKARLEETNQKLMAREEEISRQNEELQTQTEELAQQNEEIQQQSEEVQQQAEELQVQSEDLQVLNLELGKRQTLLETMLGALQIGAGGDELPARICKPLLALFGNTAAAAAVLEKSGDELVLVAHAGIGEPDRRSWDFSSCLASVVMERDQTAFVADLDRRPDLVVPRAPDKNLRSVLAAPLRVNGMPVGSIEVYADKPQEWTREHFKIIEWIAAQCSLLLEVRRLQSELMDSNAGLDQLVKARTAELQEMINELEHFSYTITHDLRAPLRAMQGFSEILAEECLPLLDEQSRGHLRRIVGAVSRMDRLITDALSFSRVVRNEMPMTAQDPEALLEGMIESYPVFQPPAARIRVDGALPPVLANEAGLTQCFSNLLGNAVKFVAPGRVPEIVIRAERREGLVRLWFVDNGIGIPADMQARVFGMFQRLSKDYEGTGIGLALVKKVAERMGGRVGVESEPGQGSRFWIEFNAA